MNIKNFSETFILITFCIATASSAIAHDLTMSGATDSFANPFVVTGFNKATKVLTGSISATRIAPGETNECRILLYGDAKTPKTLKVAYIILNAAEGVQQISGINKATVAKDGTSLKLTFDQKTLGGECDWILSHLGEPSISQQGNELFISVSHRQPGAWISVHTIKSRHANFHRSPDANDVEKTFLVAGDTISVYEERSGWYYVKFQGRKKKTVGWIKKTDTVQF
jgi:hypothetical protein